MIRPTFEYLSARVKELEYALRDASGGGKNLMEKALRHDPQPWESGAVSFDGKVYYSTGKYGSDNTGQMSLEFSWGGSRVWVSRDGTVVRD
jgi:hypothetical protein